MHLTHTKRPGSRPAGFTLLEVLIAIVIFSIGLLGIASLQLAGLRYTHTSQLRATAAMQAENIADRMRANLAGVADGHYNVTGSMPTASDSCATECDSEEIAVHDLHRWNEDNAALLPDGAGIVCIDSTPEDDAGPGDWKCDNSGDIYAIKIAWTERGIGENEADTETRTYVMRFLPL